MNPEHQAELEHLIESHLEEEMPEAFASPIHLYDLFMDKLYTLHGKYKDCGEVTEYCDTCSAEFLWPCPTLRELNRYNERPFNYHPEY